MGWFEALVLGLVQGLTEFLPISSSAHISIVGQLFGRADPGAAFTAIIQIGTEVAVVVYFAKDIGRIIRAWFLALIGRIPREDPDARMGWLVIIGSIPIIVLGLLFQDAIEHALRNLWITVAMLAGFGLVIGIVDSLATHRRTLDQLTWKHGILYGLAQSLALIPGVSRSGGTITAGLAMGYRREAATRYSFLLAIPAVLGAGFFQLYQGISGDTQVSWGPTLLAGVVAFVVGLVMIAWLLRFVATHSFWPFVIYRIILAAVVAVLLLTGVLDPLGSTP
ncbi:undecaprenyl-diphosphate phosphatase [Microlunatus sp. Gsoil 973]|jgi:undecaprenyl-diphosphatase|uniref:undecaprenyl-diphosphate phosphatase n=1 Tax=Microlunatus sp. Gsoil 973 TaxID=2672569 RepID=UPI0012B47230|nr:undecaprenyl-diphosphate phosphatase [Microlunatus sp. Gsoil 973]QGN33196.1 undecaprenyl-diphosphate phosphatase [Microlunatus sp. Gsoil 973]